MIRKLKTLGVAVLAVLALSAVVASAASATNFTASKYPTAATAESELGNDDFKTEAGSVECKGHFAVAALSEPSPTATITPTYTNCKAFGFLNATVNMNGCDYVLHTSGSADLKCPSGQSVTITAGTCEIMITEILELEFIKITNGMGGGLIILILIEEIIYHVTKDGIGCPFNGTGTKTGASYTQNKSITASSTNGATIDVG